MYRLDIKYIMDKFVLLEIINPKFCLSFKSITTNWY